MYKIEELVKSAKEFGVGGALVAAALKMSGKTEFTFEEAKKIVKEFADTVVK